MKLRNLFYYFLPFFILSCATTVKTPMNFVERKINTSTGIALASYIKDTSSTEPVYIYVEGDGYAFNSMGKATKDPTPKGTFLRELAFGDERRNVVYLARPCQYIMSKVCSQVDWTSGRYSPRNVKATMEAINQIASGRRVVLIGFSGGALMSGLVIQNSNIKVNRWITISGLLNHKKWAAYHKTPSLNKSLSNDSCFLPSSIFFAKLHTIIGVPYLFTKFEKCLFVASYLISDKLTLISGF